MNRQMSVRKISKDFCFCGDLFSIFSFIYLWIGIPNSDRFALRTLEPIHKTLCTNLWIRVLVYPIVVRITLCQSCFSLAEVGYGPSKIDLLGLRTNGIG